METCQQIAQTRIRNITGALALTWGLNDHACCNGLTIKEALNSHCKSRLQTYSICNETIANDSNKQYTSCLTSILLEGCRKLCNAYACLNASGTAQLGELHDAGIDLRAARAVSHQCCEPLAKRMSCVWQTLTNVGPVPKHQMPSYICIAATSPNSSSCCMRTALYIAMIPWYKRCSVCKAGCSCPLLSGAKYSPTGHTPFHLLCAAFVRRKARQQQYKLIIFLQSLSADLSPGRILTGTPSIRNQDQLTSATHPLHCQYLFCSHRETVEMLVSSVTFTSYHSDGTSS